MHRSLLLLTLLVPAVLHAQAPPLALTSPNPEASGFFGISVSGVPDVDGDGRGDLLIGAQSEAGGTEDAGRAYLFSGDTGTLLRTLESPNPGGGQFNSGAFGGTVSGIPDADGDGRGDLLIGAHYEDGGAPAAGRAYLFSGATGALLHTLTSPNPLNFGDFGEAVSGVSDVDGDGRGDLLIGALGENGGRPSSGRAYLFSGATGTLLHTLTSPNFESQGYFGQSVSGVLDVDGDGRGDLLIGANFDRLPGADNGGLAYVFSGATGVLLRTLDSAALENGDFGFSVAGVPDVDGDDHNDFLVGAPSEDGGAEDAGRAYLFSGATGTLLRTLESPNPQGGQFNGGAFGASVSGMPDADGDGKGDLLIGAVYESGGALFAGRAYVFSGATGALLGTLTSPNPGENGYFGFSVSGLEDTDGDGRGDLLIGAALEDGGASNTGRAYLFSGGTLVSSEPGPETPALGLTVVPNPARDRAAFTLSLPAAGPVRLSVHDVLGREVSVLLDGAVEAGAHTVAFEASGLSSGVYVWRLASGGSVQTGRLTLIE